MSNRPLAVAAALVAASLSSAGLAAPAAEQDLHEAPDAMRGSVGEGVPAFAVRKGYRVEIAAEGINGARFLQLGDDGQLFLSLPREGKILSLKDTDGDGTFDERADFVVEDGSNPHSMDWHDGWLYYSASEPGYLKRARDTDGDGTADEVEDIVDKSRANPGLEPTGDGIPSGGGHAFRGILVDADNNRIFLTVSDPSNMTSELETNRKTLYTFDMSGQNRQVFSTGIRNTEKIRFRIDADGELTGEVWGADHGSDWLGREYGDNRENQPITDLNPPDELNHLEEGKFYGHPYLMADRTPRPEYMDRDDLHELAIKTEPAAWSFGAHTANNGFTFVGTPAAELFGDPSMAGDLFQAQHGSWNSSVPVGYSVNRVLFDEATGKPYGEQKIVDCHDGEGRPEARPVDCEAMPDGSILWSCDMTGKVYRIVPDDAGSAE